MSHDTVQELIRVLSYQKFQLEKSEIEALLADYLLYAELIELVATTDAPQCRDPDDQIFVDLAIHAGAEILVSGDKDLPEMKAGPRVLTPAQYHEKFFAIKK